MNLLEKLKREKGVFDYISILNAVACIASLNNDNQQNIADSLIIMDAKKLDFYQMSKENEFRIYQDHPYIIRGVRYSDELLTEIRDAKLEKIRSSRISPPYWKIDDLLKLIGFNPNQNQKLIKLFAQANLDSHIRPKNSEADLLDDERLETIKKLKTENTKLKEELSCLLKQSEELSNKCNSLEDENNKLKTKVKSQQYLNHENKHFCIEMKLCHDTWNYLYNNETTSYNNHSDQVAEYLNNSHSIMVTTNSIKRISTITKPKEQPAKARINDRDY